MGAIKRILVTGASGFIGSHLLHRLSKSNEQIEVLALSRSGPSHKIANVQWAYGNLASPSSYRDTLKKFNADAVYHLAWQGIPDFSYEMCKRNLDQSLEFINFLMHETTCRKLAVSGSCWEYGKSRGACSEDDVLLTNSPFAWAKQALHQYTKMISRLQDRQLFWFRVFYVYGPGQRKQSLIPSLLQTMREGKTPHLKNPFNANDFIYIDDVIDGMMRALDPAVKPGVYNLGSGHSTSVGEVCRLIQQTLSMTSIDLPPADGEVEKNLREMADNFWADVSKSKADLQWRSKITLSEGITRFNEFEKREGSK